MKTFDQLYQEALSARTPSFEVSETFTLWMIEGIALASPITMGLSGTAMKELFMKLKDGVKLNYYEFACASNNVESRSMIDLKMEPRDYFNLMIEIESTGKLFNKETKEIRDKIIQKLAKEKIDAPKGVLSGNSLQAVR